MTAARRTPSLPMSPRPSKRAKIDDSQVESRPPTPGEDDSWRVPVDYSNGVVLAPMVRSGSRKKVHLFCLLPSTHLRLTLVPTRLLSLKYGASLVWSPEIVDKAIIGCQRIVDGTYDPLPFITYLHHGK